MSETHEVISAFLDDEPFDAQALVRAFSEPEGRTLLIDMVALRHIVQTNDAMPARRPLASRPLMRLAAVAAVFVALAGGYIVGVNRAAVSQTEAPAPTRVVQSTTGWQDITRGAQ